MRSFRFFNMLLGACLLTMSCTPAPIPGVQDEAQQTPEDKDKPEPETPSQPQETMTIRITIGGKSFKADIENSETGKAFIGKLPLTLDMSELNGNEKYCYGVSLPKADKHYDSITAGDLMLYSGNCIVLFYGPAGGYSYTRIGKLQSTDGLASALGSGSVSVKFEFVIESTEGSPTGSFIGHVAEKSSICTETRRRNGDDTFPSLPSGRQKPC